METPSVGSAKRSFKEVLGPARYMRIRKLKLPKGRIGGDCSFCVLISQLGRLSTADKLFYQQHLAKEHGLMPEITR